ncbi:MAG: molybdenum cofactor guanylyltransferase [Proteobacteria bacterium]|nr:molybdenum cofactor guanylyltransferase [Pseudomonadota bacterium]
MTKTAGLVLAGGSAQRMGGGDKPLRLLHGRTLLEHVLAALDVTRVAISANGDPARFARFGLPVLPDTAFAGRGPLAGVLAGLDWAEREGADALLTVPGDTPFIPLNLAATLAPAPATAESLGQKHNLVALWPVSARAALQRFLAAPGSPRVGRFAQSIGMRYVPFDGSDPRWFANVNTPEELLQLERMDDRRDLPADRR